MVHRTISFLIVIHTLMPMQPTKMPMVLPQNLELGILINSGVPRLAKPG
jgi:hypothetical protein